MDFFHLLAVVDAERSSFTVWRTSIPATRIYNSLKPVKGRLYLDANLHNAESRNQHLAAHSAFLSSVYIFYFDFLFRSGP
jgi:hypothetical protein